MEFLTRQRNMGIRRLRKMGMGHFHRSARVPRLELMRNKEIRNRMRSVR